MFSASSAVVALALASSACAEIYFTSPTSTIGFTGGQVANITWYDDGSVPSLASFGLASASIYAGNSIEQTSLQLINASINVTNPLYLTFTPDPTIGPNGAEYFIRFQSLSLMDATNPIYPALAFSHIFTMSGMTGTFNATVQSEIDGQSTAPIGGSAAVSATTSASVVGATSKTSTVTTSKASTSGSTTAKSAAASGSSAAAPTFVAGSQKLWLGIATGVFGAVMGAALL
ncbi:hypothetical protein DFH07DRAFT_950974 [Mycena maculata]|uniref:Ser-Thr-rich glycosyl-phosphatidyl-inositol-anchored membrane family-domain-containing protein n=1 Tax=Mycena maculata TaxID=230809 RepID=A0AAD7K3S9_9AGAR|nr:hypothetical protein DFH07DRAFT_950974 [Mycena maculata]